MVGEGVDEVAIEYRLVLAGDDSVERVAECAVPEPAERPAPTGKPHLLAADLCDQRGFTLIVRQGRNGYFEAEDDSSSWKWELITYVNLTFRMVKEEHVETGIPNMLAVVKRVMDGRAEDAALILNGEVLLLTRTGGMLRKHNRGRWWDHYGFVNDIITG